MNQADETNRLHLVQRLDKQIEQLGYWEDKERAALCDKLIRYLFLLARWNRVVNLTAVGELDAMLARHLLESVQVVPYLTGSCFIDVGSGGGLPGVVLACACPDKHFVLLDKRMKKTRFLTHVKMQLQLENVSVVTSRVQDYHPDVLFDGIVTRAFAKLSDMVTQTRHLRHAQGQWLALKGRRAHEELADVANCKTQVIPLSSSKKNDNVQACLVIIQ